MVSMAAALLHIEAALIVPRFTMQYHSYSAFYAGFVGLLLAQTGVSLGTALAARPRAVSDRGSAPADSLLSIRDRVGAR
jgi:hypothetical protein